MWVFWLKMFEFFFLQNLNLVIIFQLFLYNKASFIYLIVNKNSKYKEDDFADSNAVNYSQDVCIHFRHEAPTCHPRPSTHPIPSPLVRVGVLG